MQQLSEASCWVKRASPHRWRRAWFPVSHIFHGDREETSGLGKGAAGGIGLRNGELSSDCGGKWEITVLEIHECLYTGGGGDKEPRKMTCLKSLENKAVVFWLLGRCPPHAAGLSLAKSQEPPQPRLCPGPHFLPWRTVSGRPVSVCVHCLYSWCCDREQKMAQFMTVGTCD